LLNKNRKSIQPEKKINLQYILKRLKTFLEVVKLIKDIFLG